MSPTPNPSAAHGHGSIGEFVSRLRPEPKRAFLSLRAVALSLGPDVIERVTDSSVEYLRRLKPFLRVESLRSRLLAVFPPHVDVPDPSGRLLRRGPEKYMRIEGESLDAHVQDFVRRAYTLSR